MAERIALATWALPQSIETTVERKLEYQQAWQMPASQHFNC
jgi:hypothetical protein